MRSRGSSARSLAQRTRVGDPRELRESPTESMAADPERPCPLCGATTVRLVIPTSIPSAAGVPYRVVACTACGLRYTRPLPSAAELEALYPPGYHTNNSPRLWSRDFPRVVLERWVMWERRRDLTGLPRGRVLDVGCGNGRFLASLKVRGWTVQGTDTSAPGCEVSRSRGIPVHHGDLAGGGFPDGSFDVVTLWHVLEHVAEPLTELAEIRRILRPGGRLVVQVPDADSLTLRLCGDRWFPFDVPRHLQHFTAQSLRETLERAGFVTLRERRFQLTDVAASFYSFLRVVTPPRSGSVRCFGRDYKFASVGARMRFLAVGLPILACCFLYTPCARVLTGHGETITASCRVRSP
jgi:SAM-dependent methyltransferase